MQGKVIYINVYKTHLRTIFSNLECIQTIILRLQDYNSIDKAFDNRYGNSSQGKT